MVVSLARRLERQSAYDAAYLALAHALDGERSTAAWSATRPSSGSRCGWRRPEEGSSLCQWVRRRRGRCRRCGRRRPHRPAHVAAGPAPAAELAALRDRILQRGGYGRTSRAWGWVARSRSAGEGPPGWPVAARRSRQGPEGRATAPAGRGALVRRVTTTARRSSPRA